MRKYDDKINNLIEIAKSNKGDLNTIFNSTFMADKWSELFGKHVKIACIIGLGGIGKTFGLPRKFIKRFLTEPNYKGFVWFVENTVMAKDLCANDGHKFFLRALDYYKTNKYQQYLKLCKEVEDEDGNKNYVPDIKVKSGLIKCKGRILGYILPISEYRKLKGSNFIVDDIVLDEFIPEKLTYQTIEYAKAFASVQETTARADSGVKVYLCANPIRLKDGILKALQSENIEMGQTIVGRLPNGEPYCATHYIDTFQPNLIDFMCAKINSASGSIAISSGNMYRLFGIPALDVDVPIATNEQIKNAGTHILYNIEHHSFKLTILVCQETNKLIVTDYFPNRKHSYCLYKQFVTTNVIMNNFLRVQIEKIISLNNYLYQSVGHYEMLLQMCVKPR